MSFGFDTACRTYAEQIGNICIDCVSSKVFNLLKYRNIIISSDLWEDQPVTLP